MCFSASASFAVAAALVPAGVYCLKTASCVGARWISLAAYPLAFAVQQIVEGVLWLGIESDDQAVIYAASRGFLFFSHFFWLAWVPFSVYWLADEQWRRRLLLGLSVVGALFGLSIFLPLLLMADWLSVEQVEHSIEYKTVLIYDGVVGRPVLRGLYALIILSALFLSSNRRVRLLAGLIAASFVGAYFYYSYAFISVWCFFAAVLSTYIVAILAIERRQHI
jgi:hypothetical protein